MRSVFSDYDTWISNMKSSASTSTMVFQSLPMIKSLISEIMETGLLSEPLEARTPDFISHLSTFFINEVLSFQHPTSEQDSAMTATILRSPIVFRKKTAPAALIAKESPIGAKRLNLHIS
jgi:hypothetical protein